MYLPRDPDLSFQNALKQFLQVIKPVLRECSFAKAMEIHKLSFYMEKNALSITTLIRSEKNFMVSGTGNQRGMSYGLVIIVKLLQNQHPLFLIGQ